MMNRLAASFLLIACCASLAAGQAMQTRVRVSSGVSTGLLRTKVNPAYPPLARQAHIQGVVILQVTINKAGDVQNIVLFSGHPMLAPAAIEAVKQWKYAPYLLNGEPVEVETSVQVYFTLSDNPPGEGAGLLAAAPSPLLPGPVIPQNGISESVMRSIRTKRVDVVYPPLAEQERIQGQVILSVKIDKSGEVTSLSLISGHPMFVQPAMEAVKQWEYKPYLLNGEPIEADTIVRLNFTLPLSGVGPGRVDDAPVPLVGVVGTIRSTIPPGTPPPKRVRVSSGVAQGLLIRKVNPAYPADAREQHIQGVVVLQAKIDKEGNVAELQVISGDPLLTPAAIDAVRQWKYRPYLLNGEPVEVETQIQVNFTLVE